MSEQAISDTELWNRIQESLDAQAKLSASKRHQLSYTYLTIKWVDPTPVLLKLSDIGHGPRRVVSKAGCDVLLSSIIASAQLVGSECTQAKFLKKGIFGL